MLLVVRQVIRYMMRALVHLVTVMRRTSLRVAKPSFRLDWLDGVMTALKARAPPPATPS